MTHAGMTRGRVPQDCPRLARDARHARFDRRYTELVYQPMLELLAYLRANSFKTFIVEAAASSSCGRGSSRSTAFRRNK